MINSVILSYVTFLYFFCFLFYLLKMTFNREWFGKIGSYLSLIGFLGNTGGLIIRWIESHKLGIGHAPLSNLYESLVFFAWSIMLLYLITEWKTKNRSFGVFVTPIAFLLMAYASFSPNINSRIQPLVPALKSNWLIAHVITCFLGYSAFGIAFGLSIMYLVKNGNPESSNPFISLIPDTSILDEISYQMILIGFLLLTLGIITGSVWAHSAWGSYWSWDPKETWSLITWLVYASLLHSRMMRGWRGKRIAILSIIGFICVLFTYLGVNYLPGLHSYATS